MKIEPTAIYLCDNGAAYCGDHLGMTAKHTGRDISGQEIYRVTPDDVAYMGLAVRCEKPGCGRRASALWTA